MPPANGTYEFIGLPIADYGCSNPSSPNISRNDIENILEGEFLQHTIDPGRAFNRTGYIWREWTKSQTTQLYVCNYNPSYELPLSVGYYKLVNQLLDEKCGDLGGWAYFVSWNLQIGRGLTDSFGGLTGECGWAL